MRPARILVVCTANVCRSPVAERLLHHHLSGVDFVAVVSSAGTHGGRNLVHDDTVRAGERVGVDLRSHVSRPLTAPLIDDEGADLVITMTREHLRHVAGMSPEAWPRTFTLKELARRALQVPTAVADLDEWVRHAGAGRRAADLMTPSPDDDVSDPYGRPFAEHVAMVAEVDELTRRVAQMLSAVSGVAGPGGR